MNQDIDARRFVRATVAYGADLREALEKLQRQGVRNPILTILFASSLLDQDSIAQEVRSVLGGHSWGLSCAGHFNGEQENLSTEGIQLLAIEQRGDVIAPCVVMGSLDEEAEERARRLTWQAFDGADFSPELLYIGFTGKRASEMLRANPFTLLVGHSTVGSEESVLRGISRAVGRGARVVGGTAADRLYLERVTETYAHGNGRADKGALSLLGIATTLKNGVGMANAFRPMGANGAFVTESEGRVIKSLNHRPAADVYAELVGVSTWKEAQESFRNHPMGIIEATANYWQVRSPAAIQEDGSIVFFSEIPEGSGLTLLEADASSRVESVRVAVRRALADAGNPKRVAAVVAFNCILCHQQALCLGSGSEEVRAIREELGAHVAVIGASTYGETGTTVAGTIGHHNQTVTLWLLADEAITQ
ncbi:MAG: FIST signal transduction protein [Candidatus Methylacidiphilaceae bacterium]